jgi:sulfite exporter TauE/SafE/copper chaperone CopZ
MKKETLYVKGAHCESCKLCIEDELAVCCNASCIEVDVHRGVITFESEDTNTTELAQTLTKKLASRGYIFSTKKLSGEKKNEKGLWQAILIGVGILVLFFVLQKSGILNFGIGGKPTPMTGFLVGLVASVSSCLAVVGGLVLSLSAKIAENGSATKKPFYLFHAGRLVGFAVLGGALGLIGKGLGVNYVVQAVLMIVASVVMIGLGLNLTGIFKRSKLTLPSSLFKFFRNVENQTFAPLLLGVGTFFLPCGFTQSMQVTALGSGSLVTGSLIMFFFALGTLPVLVLLSFGSVSFAQSRYAGLFFKTAGVVVIGLGIFALLSQFVALGIISPLFTI